MFSFLLVLGFTPALRHKDDPRLRWKAFLVAMYIVDLLANVELCFLFLDIPKYGEWTVSKRIPRLCLLPGRRGVWAIRIRHHVNSKSPGHIKYDV